MASAASIGLLDRKKNPRQGFSIDELMAGATSDNDDDDGNASDGEDNKGDQTMRTEFAPPARAGTVANAALTFLDEDEDADNEAWVQQHFAAAADRVELMCPACFVPVTYVSRAARDGVSWEATRVVHCAVVVATAASDKRAIVCAECGADLGVSEPGGLYRFQHVIPSISGARDI